MHEIWYNCQCAPIIIQIVNIAVVVIYMYDMFSTDGRISYCVVCPMVVVMCPLYVLVQFAADMFQYAVACSI